MSQPDFEFQFGLNRTLKGRGLLGVVALAIVVLGIVFIPTNAARLLSAVPSWVASTTAIAVK
ncbi:MAG: hypothetical protein QOF41_2402 [Methylobacteriaceae bacterium]|nr:hypothetical protein [Methylobacteriaceae bacterium]